MSSAVNLMLPLGRLHCLSPQWSLPVRALMTTRRIDPVDTRSTTTAATESLMADYGDFNLAQHVGDDAQAVTLRRDSLQTALGGGQPVWLQQVHGDHVEVLTQAHPADTLVADAAISFDARFVPVVMTADCLPLLLAAADGRAVAAVHCGWRSLAAGIIERTLARLQRHNAGPYHAWLGVGIGPDAFEVGAEVRAQFIAKGFSAAAFVALPNDATTAVQKYWANLPALVREALVRLGLTQIEQAAGCTYLQPQLFYSYRRSAITGRMATLIQPRA